MVNERTESTHTTVMASGSFLVNNSCFNIASAKMATVMGFLNLSAKKDYLSGMGTRKGRRQTADGKKKYSEPFLPFAFCRLPSTLCRLSFALSLAMQKNIINTTQAPAPIGP